MSVAHSSGGTSITGSAILGMRGLVCLQGLRLYATHGSKLRLTRMATPALLRAVATEFTGKPYSRSPKGMASALKDMEALASGKTLNELGEVRTVNALVGGVASDLSS